MNDTQAKKHVTCAYDILKYTFGFAGLIVGADKFTNLITHWAKYVSPQVASFLPVSLEHFLYVIGIIEIIVGLLILTKFTKLGAYLMAAWLLIVAANLCLMGLYDIAFRDVVMASGALALACLASSCAGSSTFCCTK